MYKKNHLITLLLYYPITKLPYYPIFIPLNRPFKPLLKIHSRLESKLMLRPGSIQHPPRLSIWFRFVPDNLPFETGQFDNQFYQILNLYFKSSPDIDWFRFVVLLRCQDNPFRTIFHIDEFTGDLTSAPDHDLAFNISLGIIVILTMAEQLREKN